MTIIAPLVFGIAGITAVAVITHSVATRWADVVAVLRGERL